MKLNLTQQSGKLSEHKGLIRSTPEFDLQLDATPPAASAQNGASGGDARQRIVKEIEEKERLIGDLNRQLNDEASLSKKPEKVVTSLRAKLADYEQQLAKSKKVLENLG